MIYNGIWDKSKYENALAIIAPLAMKGIAEAQFRMGWMYIQGDAVEKSLEDAALWFEKAAKQGHADAGHEIATAYRQGDGVVADYDKAKYWFEEAGKNGRYDSRYNLKNLEEFGIDTPEKKVEAEEFYGYYASI